MLTTERLIIRPYTKNDFEDYYLFMSLPETYRFEPGQPISLSDAKKFCREFDGKMAPGFFAAELNENRKVIGHVSFFPKGPPDFKTWEVGYIFNPTYQNKGYATEATKAVIRYAFNELGAHRVTAGCSPDNIGSWKVLEKCGMKREGLEKKNFLHHDENGNPVWFDSYSYAILDEELK